MGDRRILTFTGKLIDIFDLKSEDICLADIAHALSTKTRFNGMCMIPYSIAQHSCLAMDYCKYPLLQSIALLHDAEEAYVADVPGPWKKTHPFNEVDEIGVVIRQKIWTKYIKEYGQIDSSYFDYKWIDKQLCTAEIRALVKNWQQTTTGNFLLEINVNIIPWSWERSEWESLKRLDQLGLKD